MNNLVKAGVGAALALGAVAAHATITPGSSSATGNAILFVDVFNGSSFVQAYVGDTGQATTGLTTSPPAADTDPLLLSFLSTYATAGTTTYWALEGGGLNPNTGKTPYIITSSQTATTVQGETGSLLKGGSIGVSNQIFNNVVPPAGSANSIIMSSDASIGGSGFNPLALAADVANWEGDMHGQVTTTGLGTSSTIYKLTAPDTGSSSAVVTALFSGTLTMAGLSFAPLAVPIPAALWLLGSGLLGLFGVARRRLGVV
jgi:hypothetical protein